MEEKSELLTLEEAANLLRLNPETVRRHVAGGRLPAVKIGRRIRIRRDTIDNFAGGGPVREAAVEYRVEPETKRFSSPSKLTDAEATAALSAIQQARAFRNELKAQRGGALLSESWHLIREAREADEQA
jgi:excisionase family DNA binding protein